MRASRPGRAPVGVLGRCLGAATGAASALVLGWTPAIAVDVNRMPPPPATPVEHHDPDPHTCNSERLLQAWSQQLQPYSDQPAAVLERLKLVQRDMAVVTAVVKGELTDGLLSACKDLVHEQQVRACVHT